MIKNEEKIQLPIGLATFVDKRTGYSVFTIPIDFPDGTKGNIAIVKLKKGRWKVEDDMRGATINGIQYPDTSLPAYFATHLP